jgi:hypothetical protein
MMQVVQRIEACIANGEIDLIHVEDGIVRTPYVALMTGSHSTSHASADEVHAAMFEFVAAMVSLHAGADAGDEAAVKQGLPRVLDGFARVKKLFTDKELGAARALADRYTCPMHPDVLGKRIDLCPKCGMPLDQLVRILPTGAAAAGTVHATVRMATPSTAGQPVDATLMLTKADGSPIVPSELIEAHLARIHLLIIDASLTDYHHEHPRPTGTPGQYAFNFTPRKPGGYRAWADLRPYPLGLQEYAIADIPGAGHAEQLMDKAPTSRAEVDGLRFELVLPQRTIKAGRSVPAQLRIMRTDGRPFTELEPIMGAFAHLVAFHEDRKTVLHIHPKGAPVLDAARRGGPRLDFQIYAPQPGFYRLFAQVQVAGSSKLAPFGLGVAP